VPVAALAGTAAHAGRHVDNGVDIVVAQGYEAGGHTGEIASMVLVPAVVDAVGDRIPVLAAGGIGCDRQVLAAHALGASGVWTGSYWPDHGRVPARREPCPDRAGACDVERHGPVADLPGQTRAAAEEQVTQAWAEPDAPEPLPLQNMLVGEAHLRMMRGGDPSAVAMPVGQIVGRMNEIRPVAEVMASLLAEIAEARARLKA
jgi:NAD(P)H-dependent flavin oxidoreductase YrpB (nitropropane dioxygenase family)